MELPVPWVVEIVVVTVEVATEGSPSDSGVLRPSSGVDGSSEDGMISEAGVVMADDSSESGARSEARWATLGCCLGKKSSSKGSGRCLFAGGVLVMLAIGFFLLNGAEQMNKAGNCEVEALIGRRLVGPSANRGSDVHAKPRGRSEWFLA